VLPKRQFEPTQLNYVKNIHMFGPLKKLPNLESYKGTSSAGKIVPNLMLYIFRAVNYYANLVIKPNTANYICIISDMFRPQIFGHLQGECFFLTKQRMVR
jgi:hypothetical protein